MTIILTNPRYPHNVGAVTRAASCFNVPEVLITGDRVLLEPHPGYRLPREERMRGRYKVDLRRVTRPIDELKPGQIPVAIELVPGAQNMIYFEHPDEAAYLFGPEDGSLDKALRRHCHHVVALPMLHCANLAMAVGITLYDRHSKRVMAGLEAPLRLDEERNYLLV